MSPTSIFPSVSGRDPEHQAKLLEHFERGGPTAAAAVTCLRTDAHEEDDSCWLHTDGACLSTRPLESSGVLDAYVGAYQISPGTEVLFRVERGELHVISPAGGGPLTDLGNDRFESPGVAQMRFVRSDDGTVQSVVIEFGGNTMEAKRVS